MASTNESAEYPGVVRMPGRVGGKPMLGESRVPAELVTECLDEDEAPEEVADNYDFKLVDVLKFKLYRDSLPSSLLIEDVSAHGTPSSPKLFFCRDISDQGLRLYVHVLSHKHTSGR